MEAGLSQLVGRRIGGQRHGAWGWTELESKFKAVLPVYPGESVLAPVRVPAPPLLDHELPRHKQAVELAEIYVALTQQFSQVWYAFDSPLKHDRHYLMLMGAAKAMVEQSIPPMAWVKFSFDVFFKYGNGRYPKPGFVYSGKRLVERLDWFGWCESFNVAQGMVWVAPEHRNLLRRYESMRQELLQCATVSTETVQEVVSKWFPDRMYKQLERAAQKQYKERRLRMEEQLWKRRWIW